MSSWESGYFFNMHSRLKITHKYSRKAATCCLFYLLQFSDKVTGMKRKLMHEAQQPRILPAQYRPCIIDSTVMPPVHQPDLPEGPPGPPDGKRYFTVDDLRPDWLEIMLREASQGRTTNSYCRALGISRAAFETVMQTSPAFAEVYDRCMLYAAEWWEETGREMACGDRSGNGPVWQAFMVNKWGWNSARQQQQVSSSSTVQVSSAPLCDEELRQELAKRGLPLDLLPEPGA